MTASPRSEPEALPASTRSTTAAQAAACSHLTARPAPWLQVAFLTGQSDPDNCALSPVQAAFLAALAAPERHLHPWNFPYTPSPAPYRDTPLLRASLNNARQYLSAVHSAGWLRHRPALLALLELAPVTVLLAGSCGLTLLQGLQLSPTAWSRLHVFAYGPVARRLPPCPLLAVRGRQDWISRLGYAGPIEIVPGGHLDTLQQPETLALCQRWLAQIPRPAA